MKKFLSVILLLVFVMSIFAACSDAAKEDDASQDSDVNITVDSHYENIDESSVRAYEKLCTAVVNGDSKVKFNTSLLDDVNQLFYTCFPLYPLVESIDLTGDSTGVTITYKNTAEEHLELVNAFYDKVDEIMQACEYGKVSTDRYIFNVYTYITSNMQSDSSVVTAYDAIMQGKGYSAAICSAFEYLVLQGGGKASHVISASDGQKIMSAAEFKDGWYYFDPAADIEDNGGKALTGFAVSSDRDGLGSFNYTDGEPVDIQGSESFEKLAYSVSYTVDGDTVNVTCSDGQGEMNISFE